MNVEVSRDGGATWSRLATVRNLTAVTGAYDWLVTGPVTTQALVRVSWAGNGEVRDASRRPFAIVPEGWGRPRRARPGERP